MKTMLSPRKQALRGAKPHLINISYANVASTCDEAFRAEREWSERIHRSGAGEFAAHAEADGTLRLRRAAASLLRCEPSDCFGCSSATEALTNLAWSLLPRFSTPGSNVVSAAAAFPSTVYPFARVLRAAGGELRLAPHDARGYTEPDALLGRIDRNTRAVIISHVEYASGQR